MFVNHWPSRRDGVLKTSPYRESVARTLLHLVDSLLNQDPLAKVIIMGDFNDTEENPSFNKVLGSSQIGEEIQSFASGPNAFNSLKEIVIAGILIIGVPVPAQAAAC